MSAFGCTECSSSATATATATQQEEEEEQDDDDDDEEEEEVDGDQDDKDKEKGKDKGEGNGKPRRHSSPSLYLAGSIAGKSEPPAPMSSNLSWAMLLPIAAVLAFVGLWRVARNRTVGVNSREWMIVEEPNESGEEGARE
jgi:hypothetical protein